MLIEPLKHQNLYYQKLLRHGYNKIPTLFRASCMVLEANLDSLYNRAELTAICINCKL
jgi:hypothetical protein